MLCLRANIMAYEQRISQKALKNEKDRYHK